jgi:hypothetical protein
MMNFNNADQPHQVLSEIMTLINETRLQDLIDRPIIDAASKFNTANIIFTEHKSLIDCMGRFVQHLYINGLKPSMNLSFEQAKSEALDLILLTGDFDKIYLKAINDPEVGLESALQIITESIIEKRRKIYVQKVLFQFIPPFDSTLIFELTKILIEELRPHLPAHLQVLPISMFTTTLHELVLVKSGEDKTLQNMLTRENYHL